MPLFKSVKSKLAFKLENDLWKSNCTILLNTCAAKAEETTQAEDRYSNLKNLGLSLKIYERQPQLYI